MRWPSERLRTVNRSKQREINIFDFQGTGFGIEDVECNLDGCAFSKPYPLENYVIPGLSDIVKFMMGWVLQWLSATWTRLGQRRDLLLEFIALRHQLAVLQRTGTRRPCFRPSERLFWVLLSRWWANWQRSLIIVQPATVVRWRRLAGRHLPHRLVGALECGVASLNDRQHAIEPRPAERGLMGLGEVNDAGIVVNERAGVRRAAILSKRHESHESFLLSFSLDCQPLCFQLRALRSECLR
jgi:hypothetical protein